MEKAIETLVTSEYGWLSALVVLTLSLGCFVIMHLLRAIRLSDTNPIEFRRRFLSIDEFYDFDAYSKDAMYIKDKPKRHVRLGDDGELVEE